MLNLIYVPIVEVSWSSTLNWLWIVICMVGIQQTTVLVQVLSECLRDGARKRFDRLLMVGYCGFRKGA